MQPSHGEGDQPRESMAGIVAAGGTEEPYGSSLSGDRDPVTTSGPRGGRVNRPTLRSPLRRSTALLQSDRAGSGSGSGSAIAHENGRLQMGRPFSHVIAAFPRRNQKLVISSG